MEKKYLRRVLDQCTKAELIYWWVLRLLMVGGMIFAVVHAVDLIKCVIGYILVKKNVWMRNIVK